MGVKGKKLYSVYLNEENTEFVKGNLQSKSKQGGLSLLFDKCIGRTSIAIAQDHKLKENLGHKKSSVSTIYGIFKKSIRKEDNHDGR